MYVIKMKTLLLYILIFTLTLTGSHFIFAKTEEDGGVGLPVLMYHSICKDEKSSGRFVISVDAFRQDLEYLKENGYTTVSYKEIDNYVQNGTPLPEKPILLTFDDGYFNNYCYAYPLLKEYNAKAIISIIGKYTDLYSEIDDENPNYSHITWEQIEEMTGSGLVEIGNHSYNSHTIDKGRNGTKKKVGESLTAYTEYIYSDIGKLQEEMSKNLGYTPEIFAYPFGSVSEASYDILKEIGFKCTLGCEEKINIIKVGDKECLYMLGRYLRTNKKSAKSILK